MLFADAALAGHDADHFADAAFGVRRFMLRRAVVAVGAACAAIVGTFFAHGRLLLTRKMRGPACRPAANYIIPKKRAAMQDNRTGKTVQIMEHCCVFGQRSHRFHNAQHKGLEHRPAPVGDLDDFLARKPLARHTGRHVGDQAQAQHRQPAVAGGQWPRAQCSCPQRRRPACGNARISAGVSKLGPM